MINILLSNDDGVQAPGLEALANALKKIANVTVMAPDRNRSGASNSLTLDNPLRVRKQENGFLAVEGTPTDCVHLALTGYLDKLPDMVVSGINAGANLGDDVFYSGTVAAAMEGAFFGIPSVAFSLAGSEFQHYAAASEIAKMLILRLTSQPLQTKTLLNVNIPDLSLAELRDFKVTRLGTRRAAEPTIPSIDPRGHKIYWIGQAGPEQDAGPGTDFYAINSKQISITPVQLDLTHHGIFNQVGEWVRDLRCEV
jgi:5'-nucleotidase